MAEIEKAPVEVRPLTDREQAVLAHCVKNPVGWWTHSVNHHSEWDELGGTVDNGIAERNLAAKIAKYEAHYDAHKNDSDYKTCGERAAELAAARDAAIAASREAAAAARADETAEMDALKARIAALEAAQ